MHENTPKSQSHVHLIARTYALRAIRERDVSHGSGGCPDKRSGRPASLEVPAEERLDPHVARGVIKESFSPVTATVDDVEDHFELLLLVLRVELVRLVDGHLGVLVAVDHQAENQASSGDLEFNLGTDVCRSSFPWRRSARVLQLTVASWIH